MKKAFISRGYAVKDVRVRVQEVKTLHLVERSICIETLHSCAYTNLVGTIKYTLGGLPVIRKDVLYTDVGKGINVFSVGKLVLKVG